MIGQKLRGVARAIFLASVAGVSVLSLVPQREVPQFGIGDKIEHFGAYAGLALLGALAFPRGRGPIHVPLFLILMGIILEFLQQFSPDRAPDVADAVADALGVAAGGLVALLPDVFAGPDRGG